MDTREVLVKRADVANADIDDIIGIAAELQEAAQREADGASVEDLQAVAEELDISAEYVEAAIAELKVRREATAADAAREEAEAAKNAATRRTMVLGVLGSGAVLLLVATLAVGALAFSADSRMDAALARQERAGANLTTVIERQASLAPQLVAMNGGSASALQPLASRVKNAETVSARLEASDALAVAMAEQLGALPSAADPATAQSRADLQHEVTGIANRITTERRRFEEAKVAYEQAGRGIGAGLARGLGLH